MVSRGTSRMDIITGCQALKGVSKKPFASRLQSPHSVGFMVHVSCYRFGHHFAHVSIWPNHTSLNQDFLYKAQQEFAGDLTVTV